jgi:hypothetical protein
MAERGAAPGASAPDHGLCDLCGAENDQSLSDLVTTHCNQKNCPDRRAARLRAPRAAALRAQGVRLVPPAGRGARLCGSGAAARRATAGFAWRQRQRVCRARGATWR